VHAATTEYLSNHKISEIPGKQSTKKWLGGILKKKKKSLKWRTSSDERNKIPDDRWH